MPFTTKTTAPTRARIAARIISWIGRRQSELSNRIHAAGEAEARQNGWTVTKSTGRLGFGVRSYRDPRFDARCRQLTAGSARPGGRDRDVGHERTGVKR